MEEEYSGEMNKRSNNNGNGGGSRFNRRSGAIASESPYLKAAALVDLAEDGVGLPEEILEGSSFEKAAPLYFMFTDFKLVIGTFNSLALVILNFLERPMWYSKHLAESCISRDYYYLGDLPYLTHTESLVYEVVTLLVLMVHVLFPISYEGFHLYCKSLLNRVKVILLLILVADVVIYIRLPVNFYYLPFRIAPYLRVVFFVLNNRELQDGFLLLAGMLGTYLNVVALSALFLLFSSWLAYAFFKDTQQGETTFTSYGATLYQMFLLFTASNHPDVWIPAYKDSRWYCLFFILYVLLSIYVVTNLILAGVYDSFMSELEKQVAEKDQMRLRILKKAFSVIDNAVSWTLDNLFSKIRQYQLLIKIFLISHMPLNNGFINKEQCILLFEELNKYRTIPEIPRDDFEFVFNKLDVTCDSMINLDEFARLCNVIALKFEEKDSRSIFETCPKLYHSPASKKLKDFIRSPTFESIIVFILLVNFVAVIVETTLDVQNNSAQIFWQKAENIFGWLYVIEMALKVYTYGFENYWRDGKNQFDFCITCVIVTEEMTTLVGPHGLGFMSNGNWIRYLLIARMLRFIRLLMHIERFHAFVTTFLTLIHCLLPYLGTIFCILCIYCSLGLQIFGGIVNIGNPKLPKTDLAGYDYLLFNFNDYPNGMVTLFNLLVMGIWSPLMQSYKELTGTSWTYVYFFSFYLIAVLWLLNLIVVFVLEAFQAEMNLKASTRSVDGDKKEERREQRRPVGAKTRRHKLDDLHRRMSWSERTQRSSP
ncbi:two pore calcium channel protein 1B-like isoform X2 [Lycium ferocissimum]|uniref:two pore calcium channel protein 1B-like isoform X2 n=1 Tax=Lycium ferocissimum TaxID=112874 RepID=UPI0028151F4B|nr:two pore calcium channel protein 1B-like isoform X2 [Lycium ferocissimum]